MIQRGHEITLGGIMFILFLLSVLFVFFTGSGVLIAWILYTME